MWVLTRQVPTARQWTLGPSALWTAVRLPELKLRMPAYLFCMSWYPDFEFRGT